MSLRLLRIVGRLGLPCFPTWSQAAMATIAGTVVDAQGATLHYRGNAHTPSYVAWLGRLIPGKFGTIEQDDIGRAFVAEFINRSAPKGVVYLENAAMKQQSRKLARS